MESVLHDFEDLASGPLDRPQQSGSDLNASCLGDTIGNIVPHFPCTVAGAAPTVTCKY